MGSIASSVRSSGPIVPVPSDEAPYAETKLTDGVFYLKITTYTSPPSNGVPGFINVTVKLAVGAYMDPFHGPGWSVDYGYDKLPAVALTGSVGAAVPVVLGKIGFKLKAQGSPEPGKTGIYLELYGGPFGLSIKLLPQEIPPKVKGWISWSGHGGSGGINTEGAAAVRFENVLGKPIEPNLWQRAPGPASWGRFPPGFSITGGRR